MARALVKNIGQNASDTEAGLMSTGAQTFAGDKTFNGLANFASMIDANGGISTLAGSVVLAASGSTTILTSAGPGSIYLCAAGCYSGAGSGNFFATTMFLEHGASGLRTFAIANASYAWSASGTGIVLTNGTANTHTIQYTIIRLK